MNLDNNQPEDNQAYSSADLLNQARNIRNVGGIMQLSVVPSDIQDMRQSLLNKFALDCKIINEEYRVPILLRYAPEMNGYWMPYSYKPIEYKKGFERMREAIRSNTKLTGKDTSANFYE